MAELQTPKRAKTRLRNATWHGYSGDIDTEQLPVDENATKDLLRDDPGIEHPASKRLPPDRNSIHPDDVIRYRNGPRYEDV